MFRRVRAVLILLATFSPAAVDAQEAVITVNAPIVLLPDSARVPLRVAAVGTRLRVIEEQPEGWLKIEFNDPQFGPRVGFVETKVVRIERPELKPMDLSITKPPQPATNQPERTAAPIEQPSQSGLRSRGFARGWIDVNFGFAVAADSSYGAVLETELFREVATFTADYRSPLGAEFDFGGGVMLTRSVGIGISFAGTAHQDNAQLGISIPHPLAFDAHASDSVPTDGKLTRSEGSANIQFMFVTHISERATARFFAGPSFFRVEQEAVDDIIYDQTFLILAPVNSVEIQRYETTTISFEDASGWGFHVGGDISLFFNRVVGIGGFARYSRGKADFFDPFSRSENEFETGGFQTGGGLRLRF